MPFATAWTDLLDVWAWKPGVRTMYKFHAFIIIYEEIYHFVFSLVFVT